MNQASIAARATEFEARAEDCLARASDASLTPSARSALQENAASLRDAAARLRLIPPHPPRFVAGPDITRTPPVPAQASSRFVHFTREQKLELIAAGAPFPLPDGMLAKATANGTSAESFGLAVADHCVAARAAATREAAVDAVVARILAA
jgi:hypothetical protein